MQNYLWRATGRLIRLPRVSSRHLCEIRRAASPVCLQSMALSKERHDLTLPVATQVEADRGRALDRLDPGCHGAGLQSNRKSRDSARCLRVEVRCVRRTWVSSAWFSGMLRRTGDGEPKGAKAPTISVKDCQRRAVNGRLKPGGRAAFERT